MSNYIRTTFEHIDPACIPANGQINMGSQIWLRSEVENDLRENGYGGEWRVSLGVDFQDNPTTGHRQAYCFPRVDFDDENTALMFKLEYGAKF